jgi:hypothetical protein
VLISIKHIRAFCLYIHIGASLNDKAHRWGRERGREGEGDIMSERGRGIQSEGERGVAVRETEWGRGGDIGREGEGRRKRVREGLNIKSTFSMLEEDIFMDRVTILDFVNVD